MKSIVLTGATGMIGSAVTRYAVSLNIEVLCIIRKDSKRINNIPKNNLIKIQYYNINEYNGLNINGSYDIFYHLAWEKTSVSSRDDIESQINNIQYTMDAVHLAKRLGCKKFIGAGSQAEYGIVNEPLEPETPVNPQSGYGIAKYTAGKLSKLLCSQLDMQYNWARILSVYGPLDGENSLIMYTIRELLANRSPELTKCEQIWDYLYCDDAARALLAIGEYGTNGKFYPLGSGQRKILSEYILEIKKIISPNTDINFGVKNYYPHQPMYLCADISELSKDTGWKPEMSFENGIRKIIQSFPHCI